MRERERERKRERERERERDREREKERGEGMFKAVVFTYRISFSWKRGEREKKKSGNSFRSTMFKTYSSIEISVSNFLKSFPMSILMANRTK